MKNFIISLTVAAFLMLMIAGCKTTQSTTSGPSGTSTGTSTGSSGSNSGGSSPSNPKQGSSTTFDYTSPSQYDIVYTVPSLDAVYEESK